MFSPKLFVRRPVTLCSFKQSSSLSQELIKKPINKEISGKCNLPSVVIPNAFVESAKMFLREKDTPTVTAVAERLVKFLWSRRTVLERDKIARIPKALERKLEKETIKDSLGIADPKRKRSAKDHPILADVSNYQWKQVVYDDYVSSAFLLCRAPGVYAAALRVFSEIQRLDPDFEPTSLLDFGSGVGSCVWAANSLWQESLKQYVCVDSSKEINALAFYLFSGGDYSKHLPGMFIRRFLPISFRSTYDVVVSAYTLSELPTEKDRLALIKILWQKTSRYLVIIENGNFFGYYIIQEARNLLTMGIEGANPKKSRKWSKFRDDASVVAPCPHQVACPKWGIHTPCTFTQTYQQPAFLKRNDQQSTQTEKFSYVVFDKNKSNPSDVWPRIVRHSRSPTKNVVNCQLCTNDGNLKEVNIIKKRHGNKLYNCARKSKLGDTFPFELN